MENRKRIVLFASRLKQGLNYELKSDGVEVEIYLEESVFSYDILTFIDSQDLLECHSLSTRPKHIKVVVQELHNEIKKNIYSKLDFFGEYPEVRNTLVIAKYWLSVREESKQLVIAFSGELHDKWWE